MSGFHNLLMLEREGDSDHLVNGHYQECKEHNTSWIKHEYEYITTNEISQTSKIANHHCARKQSTGKCNSHNCIGTETIAIQRKLL